MDVTVGQTAYREMAVTMDMVAKYAELSGDYNPLHFDEEFVSQTRFGRLICQGGITTGLLHALVAMDAWGRHGLHESELVLSPTGVHWRRHQSRSKSDVDTPDPTTGRHCVHSYQPGRRGGADRGDDGLSG